MPPDAVHMAHWTVHNACLYLVLDCYSLSAHNLEVVQFVPKCQVTAGEVLHIAAVPHEGVPSDSWFQNIPGFVQLPDLVNFIIIVITPIYVILFV